MSITCCGQQEEGTDHSLVQASLIFSRTSWSLLAETNIDWHTVYTPHRRARV